MSTVVMMIGAEFWPVHYINLKACVLLSLHYVASLLQVCKQLSPLSDGNHNCFIGSEDGQSSRHIPVCSIHITICLKHRALLIYIMWQQYLLAIHASCSIMSVISYISRLTDLLSSSAMIFSRVFRTFLVTIDYHAILLQCIQTCKYLCKQNYVPRHL